MVAADHPVAQRLPLTGEVLKVLDEAGPCCPFDHLDLLQLCGLSQDCSSARTGPPDLPTTGSTGRSALCPPELGGCFLHNELCCLLLLQAGESVCVLIVEGPPPAAQNATSVTFLHQVQDADQQPSCSHTTLPSGEPEVDNLVVPGVHRNSPFPQMANLQAKATKLSISPK